MIGQSSLFIVVVLLAGAHALPPKKIIGGSYAGTGEFPYQVSLRIRGQHVCGGSIISERHILTAAHCVADIHFLNELHVISGTLSSMYGGEARSVLAVRIHPKYHQVHEPYDVAVISLSSPIQFNAVQNKIDLPSAPAPNHVTVTLSGWGKDNTWTGGVSNQLMKLLMMTITTQECQKSWNEIDNTQIRPEHICVVHPEGRSACQGDSGGPLAYNGKVIGIVSFGEGSCVAGVPNVFTSVYHHLQWIRRMMAQT